MLNANLKTKFKEADQILVNQMDKLMPTFKADDLDFVTEYDSNRVIVDPPTKPKKPKDTADKKDWRTKLKTM